METVHVEIVVDVVETVVCTVEDYVYEEGGILEEDWPVSEVDPEVETRFSTYEEHVSAGNRSEVGIVHSA